MRIKGAVLLASLLALALASTALAGTGVGAVFNLGRINSVNALSQLTGSVNARMLHVANTNTGASAGAISTINTSASASTLRAQNNGTGAALGLFVKSNGIPPMLVNSNGKVSNLNADLLDGQDSSAFLPTNATAQDSVRLGGITSDRYMGAVMSRAESAVGPGTQLSDGTFRIDVSCPSGSVLLSGGPANIKNTSTLLESFPASTTTWAARINKNGFEDNFSVVALCASKG
jgi:hypothetical protein